MTVRINDIFSLKRFSISIFAATIIHVIIKYDYAQVEKEAGKGGRGGQSLY